MRGLNFYQIAHAVWNMIPLASRTTTAADLSTGVIDADAIAANAITDTKIASGAITAGKIASGAITAGKIAAEAFAGQIIRGVQYGTITLTSVTSNTAAISAVNTSKSVLIFLGQTLQSNAATESARITLTNSTTVTATRLQTDANTTIVSFVVVEFM